MTPANAQDPALKPMRAVLGAHKRTFLAVLGFSATLNLLMLVTPVYMLQIYDRVLISASAETLLLLTAIALFLLACLGMLDWVRQRAMSSVGLTIGRDTVGPLLSSAYQTAATNARYSSSQPVRDLDSIRQFLSSPAVFAFFDVPWTPVFTGAIFIFHPLMGAVAVFGATAIVSLGFLAEFRSRLPLRSAEQEGLISHQLLESSMRNADTVKAMGMFNEFLQRWVVRHDRSVAFQTEASRRLGVLLSLSKALRFSLQVAMLGTGAYLVLQQQLTPGMMIAGSIIMGRALAPIEQGITAWRVFVNVRQAWRRVSALLESDGLPPITTGPMLPRPAGEVRAEKLSATPPDDETVVLHDIDLVLAPGSLTALVGSSGSGKSSLANAMMGIWPATQGVIRLDGADIHSWPDPLRIRHFGFLPQNVQLFDGTVAENIARLEDPSADDVIQAARLARCHDLIMRLPHNYRTRIGTGGDRLSAGQRQRVALARALYNDPAYVVLDEPDSNLDRDGEEALAGVLQALRERKTTTVLISHKVALLRHVDQIGVMHEGRLVSLGPRDDTLRRFVPRQLPPQPSAK